MVEIIVEIDASPRRAIEVIAWALHEHNKVLRKAVPDASVSYTVLGMLCNTGVPLGAPSWPNAAEVPENCRCRRRACAAAYASADVDLGAQRDE